jgi:hypothetical protein
MRTAVAALTVAFLLTTTVADPVSAGRGGGYLNTEVVEAEIVTVDSKTRLIQYHVGDPEALETLHVPATLLPNLRKVRPGSFALIEFSLAGDGRELIGIQIDGVD